MIGSQHKHYTDTAEMARPLNYLERDRCQRDGGLINWADHDVAGCSVNPHLGSNAHGI